MSFEERKITILILLLVGLFLLSNCGGAGNIDHPKNITDQQAPFTMTGESVYEKDSNPYEASGSGLGKPQAQEVLEPSFVEGKPVYKEKEKTFEPLELIADFDTKHVSFNTEVFIDGQKQILNLEGSFSADGVAIVHSKQKKENKDIGVGAVRCIDQCDSFIADVVIKKIDKDGNESYEQSQFKIPATKVDIRGQPEPKTNDSQKKSEQPQATTPESKQPQVDEPQAPTSKTNPPAPQLSEPSNKITSSDDFEAEPTDGAPSLFPDAIPTDLKMDLADINELIKPITTPTKTPDQSVQPTPKVPVSAKPKTPLQPQSEMDAIMQGIDLKLFPLELDGVYSGRAVGCYANSLCELDGRLLIKSALIAGADLTPDRKNGRGEGEGFESIDLTHYHYENGHKVYDHVVYGSGLLLKHIEEVGKLYAEKYSGEKFQTTNESVQGGGNTHHDLSHQNGLEVDVELPRMKNGSIDCDKLINLMTMWNSFNITDRFYFDRHLTCSCLYPHAKTPEEKQTLTKIYHWDGHKDHFHVRDRCTRHNLSCRIVKYDSNEKPVQCTK